MSKEFKILGQTFLEPGARACVGSGYCCHTAPCGVATRIHGNGITSCPELVYHQEEGRYGCGAVERAIGPLKEQYIEDGSPGGHILCRICEARPQADISFGPPEALGKITERQEIPVDPSSKPIGWYCYEVRGTDMYRPPGLPKTPEEFEACCRPENLITTKEGLVEGDQLLVQDLLSWNIGVIHIEEDGPFCTSPSGKMLFLIDFVHDRPDEPPRWVCTGSANLAGIKKLEVKA